MSLRRGKGDKESLGVSGKNRGRRVPKEEEKEWERLVKRKTRGRVPAFMSRRGGNLGPTPP